MTTPSQSTLSNRLLAFMPPADFAAIAPALEPVDLRRGDELVSADRPIAHVHFPESGLSSIVALADAGHQVETSLSGREGMTGLPVLLGSDRSPLATVVQLDGAAHRLAVARLSAAIEASASLHLFLLRYAHVAQMQTACTAMSNAIHGIDKRLARWLLMCRDRVDTDTLALTHDFLAVMLGVRRPGVTTALHVLEGHLLIKGERGRITIRDRAGLVAYAADAYGLCEGEYERLIGPFRAA